METNLRDDILVHLNNPAEVEKLYRKDKVAFKQAFEGLYPSITNSTLAAFWHERLNFTNERKANGTQVNIMFIALMCLVAAIIVKLPALFSINEGYFYTRNVGFVIFPALSAYFVWKNKLALKEIILISSAVLFSVFFINLLPNEESDTLVLSCIHLVLFLWCILGFSFSGGIKHQPESRLNYLRYNGDLIVMTTLILIAGGILTGITIGLFSLIELDIEEFYFNNIAIIGLVSAPILGTYLTQSNPQLVNKISPVIAKIFSPLVLVMLVTYLIAIIVSGKDLYNDREFLLLFNLLLIGVLAIIFFSIAEGSRSNVNRIGLWVLLLLSLTTVVVNGLALSAILFRITEWGITPNRSAVLGSNVLILVNLILVIIQFYRVLFKKTEISNIGKVISAYLPLYLIWIIIVCFIFPFIFNFR